MAYITGVKLAQVAKAWLDVAVDVQFFQLTKRVCRDIDRLMPKSVARCCSGPLRSRCHKRGNDSSFQALLNLYYTAGGTQLPQLLLLITSSCGQASLHPGQQAL